MCGETAAGFRRSLFFLGGGRGEDDVFYIVRFLLCGPSTTYFFIPYGPRDNLYFALANCMSIRCYGVFFHSFHNFCNVNRVHEM